MFHEEQSAHNMKALDLLAVPGHYFLDWEITVMFYSVLHLVDGYCIRHGLKKTTSHIQRNNIIRERLPQIYHKYKILSYLSRQARYTKGRNMTRAELDQASRLRAELDLVLSRGSL